MRNIFLLLFVTLALSACKRVLVPDVKICSVAGILAAGANCSSTGHDENSEMDVKELIDFFEDGAMCMSADDRRKEKTAIEQACYSLGDRCTFEMKQVISKMATVERGKN